MAGIRYIDVCSGISAPTMAWKPLGWEAVCFAEIEAAPRAVLSHHYPDTPLRGDFTEIRGDEYGPVDLLVGGTPCQSFSVAGLRGGLADDRGNLALEYLRLADRARPRWLVWENVPGVLSSNGGRDFGAILGGMGELGYGFAYRVLDAQHFGVPQRRRRVFVVGYLGDWRRAAAVLFERHSLQGNPAPRRQAGQNAPTIPSRSSAGGGLGTDFDCDGGLIHGGYSLDYGSHLPVLEMLQGVQGRACRATERRVGDAARADISSLPSLPFNRGAVDQGVFTGKDRTGGLNDVGTGIRARVAAGRYPDAPEISHCLNAGGMGRQDYETETLIAIQERAVSENPDAGPDGAGFRTDGQAYTLEARSVPQAICFSAKDHGADAGEISPTLRAGGHSGSHANAGVMPAVAFQSSQSGFREVETHATLDANNGSRRHNGVMLGSSVRRLTPRECERLQGFPETIRTVRITVCEGVKSDHASSARLSSAAPSREQSAPVAARVLIDLEQLAVLLLRADGSSWSASGAEKPASSPLSMPADAFARLAAHTIISLVPVTRDGSAASLANITTSTPHLSGSTSASVSGPEIAALASDADKFTSEANRLTRFITSPAGLDTQACEQSLQTWSCCVLAAISGFIPAETRSASSYTVEVEVRAGFTLVPFRNRMMADGPRYKMLGNSMAVPVVRWIGERIERVEALSAQREAA